ncbi:hypothetical protein PTKIN_Ptkin02bG0115700 [Pterospermum kingtungense]
MAAISVVAEERENEATKKDRGDDEIKAIQKARRLSPVLTNTSLIRDDGVDSRDELYMELWHAYAGPLVTVPRQGDLVFYFPQGHIEQVEASTNQVSDQQMSSYDLPSKILCRVVNVQLKPESDTDEVFAQVTLFPLPKQDENSLEKEVEVGPLQPKRKRARLHSFCETLTASDTSTHDMSKQPPSQELVAKDLHGNEWHFCHIFRVLVVQYVCNK